MKPLEKSRFDAAEARTPYLRYRWEYYARAIEWVMARKPGRVLELGIGPLPLFEDSIKADAEPALRPDVLMDATVAPWPFAFKTYDVLLSLQTFEHFGPAKAQAFAEARRIARAAVISFPYKWNCPGDCHHMIDEKQIAEWAGILPVRSCIITTPEGTQRIVCDYSF